MTITAIGFDFGARSIGVAYGQSLTGAAKELTPLKARDGVPNWQSVAELLAEWQPQQLVVGLPLNMDGTESDLGHRAEKFGRRLNGRFGLSVSYMDERLSSVEAKAMARERGHKGDYGKHRIDSIAARLILESWFAQLDSSTHSEDPTLHLNQAKPC